MVEGIQYGGGISSIRWKIFSTDVSTISMEEVHDQYSRGHGVWTCHIINTEEDVQYMATDTAQGVYLSGKIIFYRQSNPDFILL